MIDPSEYIFYVGYLLLCLLAILLQIKLQSVENILITTTEFKAFQFHYLFGYLGIILGEILSVGSFYSTLVSTSSSHGASLTDQQITQLFLVSILSTTIFSLLNEVMDVCSKRMKCILSGILFSLATLTLFSSHFDILIFGRILYGGGSVLLHSGFDSYLIHEHNSQGFPDDWLNNTFGRLVHSMVVVTMISGVLGQYVYSMFGPHGNLIFLSLLFAAIGGYISSQWNSDISGKRCMLNTFFQSVGQAARAIRANTQTALVIVLSACMEATILIFSFYWAPWLSQIYLSSFPSATATATTEGTISASRYLSVVNTTVSPLTEDLPGPSALLLPVSPLPLVLIYSSLMTMAMIGHYLHTLALPSYGNDHIFQGVLWVSLGGYLVAAMTSTASLSSSSLSLIYLISLAIQLCSGVYWPCVGFLRGRYILPEIRGVVISLTRVLSCLLVFLLLWFHSDSPFAIFLGCCGLHLVALFALSTISKLELKLHSATSLPENDF